MVLGFCVTTWACTRIYMLNVHLLLLLSLVCIICTNYFLMSIFWSRLIDRYSTLCHDSLVCDQSLCGRFFTQSWAKEKVEEEKEGPREGFCTNRCRHTQDVLCVCVNECVCMHMVCHRNQNRGESRSADLQ